MKAENNNNEDFEKGFENGLENIEKSNYEGYLSSEVSLDWLLGTKENHVEEILDIKSKIENTKVEKLEILKQKQEQKNLFEEQTHLIDQMEGEIAFQNDKINQINDQKAKNVTPYPFLAGLLYLLAGATFIAGDLIISHEIVAYALNIRNNFEAWAFAVGLASVSVLLKPAYERLIEQPYLTNYNAQTKKVYGYFQTVLIVISIGTLSILGWFRYEAYKTDKLKEGINRQIKTLQLEATPITINGQAINNQAITLKIEEKLKQYDQLNQKLVDSPWALWSFVLSGVLFALAGAICLGIAFPVLTVFYKRWFQLNPVKNLALRRIKKKTKMLNALKTPWFKAKTALEFEDERLGLLPDIEELKIRKNELDIELLTLNEKIKLAIESGRVSNYTEGYESGFSNRNNMNDDEFANYRKNMMENISHRREDADTKTAKTYRNNGLRPHQALRKAISDSFNEN
jgi:hypothetical protein